MAEPVGLALGTVALASLFNTCIELIDLFEVAQNYEYDYKLACLKLSLLRTRLKALSKTYTVVHNCEDENKTTDLSDERIIIYQSLQGIAGIFSNANLLKEKYDLVPRRARKSSGFRSRNDQAPALACDPTSYSGPQLNKSSHFRRSTVWAIRDKQRFDALIADLDFFISSLEAIALAAQVVSKDSVAMSSHNTSRRKDRSTTKEDDNDVRYYDKVSNHRAHRDKSPSHAVMVHRRAVNQSVPVKTEATDHSTGYASTAEGYKWRVEEMHDQSAAFFGTVDDAKLEPAPKGQIASFSVGLTRDNARVVGGAISNSGLETFLNGPASKRTSK